MCILTRISATSRRCAAAERFGDVLNEVYLHYAVCFSSAGHMRPVAYLGFTSRGRGASYQAVWGNGSLHGAEYKLLEIIIDLSQSIYSIWGN